MGNFARWVSAGVDFRPREDGIPGTRVPRGLGIRRCCVGVFRRNQLGSLPYLVANTSDFLHEINPARRGTAISDAEQLGTTCAVAVCGEPSQILLLGTDDQNVSAWTNKGYAKKGAACILNQATAKWISIRKLSADVCYLRSGRASFIGHFGMGGASLVFTESDTVRGGTK